MAEGRDFNECFFQKLLAVVCMAHKHSFSRRAVLWSYVIIVGADVLLSPLLMGCNIPGIQVTQTGATVCWFEELREVFVIRK